MISGMILPVSFGVQTVFKNVSTLNREIMHNKIPFHAPETTSIRSNQKGTGGLSSK